MQMCFDEFFYRMNMDYKKFLITFGITGALLFLAVISFNIVTNPYGIYRLPGSVVGLNRYPEQGEAMERMAKPLHAAAYKPETVIVGNSLINIGINPDDYEQVTGRRTYNLSVDSARPYEVRRYVEHMLATDKNLKEVIVAVDITAAYPVEKFQAGFDEQQIGLSFQSPAAFAKAALSVDAVKAGLSSFRLNRSQRIEYPSHYQSGMISDGQQERNYGPIWFYKFLQLNLRTGSERNRSLAMDSLDEYRQMQRMCAEHGVEFRLFVPPMSALAMAAYADFYGEGAMETFLRELAGIAPCCDFSGIGPWNEQASPDAKGAFWDAHHMKPELGKHVMSVLGGQEAPAGWEGFGVWLQEQDIHAYALAKQRERTAWCQEHPKLWHEVTHLGIFAREEMKLPAPSEGSVCLDQFGGRAWADAVEAKAGETINIRGRSTCTGDWKHDMYLALQGDGGVWYTSMAAPDKRSNATQPGGNDSGFDMGFELSASTADLKPGLYGVFLWEVSTEGSRLFGPLGTLSLKE